jgi:hypothetical protein
VSIGQADGDPMKSIIKNPHSRREVISRTEIAAVFAGRVRDQKRRRQDEQLDDALIGTFPASDPVSSMTFVSSCGEA